MQPDPPEPHRLQGAGRADCVVIGAGFTGLAAARQVASLRPDWRVAVLERDRVAAGASGQSMGVIGRVAARKQRRGAGNDALSRLIAAGHDGLAEAAARDENRCGWSAVPRFDVGSDARSPWVRSCSQARLACEAIDAATVRAMTGSAAGAGLRTETSVVQPVGLLRALANALPENVDLFECSEVVAIRRADAIEVETRDAALRTDHLLVATNFSAELPGLRRRPSWPVHTYSSLSHPVDESRRARLGEARQWVLVTPGRGGFTMRCTAEGRIGIRHGFHYSPRRVPAGGRLERARRLHQSLLAACLPELEGLEVEHTWSGSISTTLTGAPWFGELAPGISAAGAYGGNGIALGTGLGGALADHVLGRETAATRDARSLPRPGWLPPGAGRAHTLLMGFRDKQRSL